MFYRQSFSSPRRQSIIKGLKKADTVVMDTIHSATPPTKQSSADMSETNKVSVASGNHVDKSRTEKGKMKENGLVTVDEEQSGGMERRPAPTMSDTDAESEWDSEPVAIPTQSLSDLTTSSHRDEIDGHQLETLHQVKQEKEGGDAMEMSELQIDPASNDDDNITGSNNPSNEVVTEGDGMEVSSRSMEDLLAIMGSSSVASEAVVEPSHLQPHTMSQCSVMSLDGLLGDTAYFLHFRVVSKSGQKYVICDVPNPDSISDLWPLLFP